MNTSITVGETNYGFTDSDLNNMTLAELEMFINNMIDTSMSYKDTNGTKYGNSDKVSGFKADPYDRFTYNTLLPTANEYYQLFLTYSAYATAEDQEASRWHDIAASNAYIGNNNGAAAASEQENLHRGYANSYRTQALNYLIIQTNIVNSYIPNCDSLKLKAKNIANSIFGNEQYGLKIKNIYTVYQTISDSARQVAHRLERLLSTKL